jgi:hypothetical protein
MNYQRADALRLTAPPAIILYIQANIVYKYATLYNEEVEIQRQGDKPICTTKSEEAPTAINAETCHSRARKRIQNCGDDQPPSTSKSLRESQQHKAHEPGGGTAGRRNSTLAVCTARKPTCSRAHSAPCCHQPATSRGCAHRTPPANMS